MSEEEAEKLFKKYFDNKPSIKTAIDKTHEFVQKYGYVESLHGHRRFIRNAQSKDKKQRNEALRQSFNAMIQGLGGWFTNMSLTYIDDFIQKYNMKSVIMVTVHDSIVVDAPPEEVETMKKVVLGCMENLPFDFLYTTHKGKKIRYPIKADMEIGLNYNDLVEYDDELVKTFNSYKGYIKYMLALQKINDYFESGVISKEKKEEQDNRVKNNIHLFQQI